MLKYEGNSVLCLGLGQPECATLQMPMPDSRAVLALLGRGGLTGVCSEGHGEQIVVLGSLGSTGYV